MIHMYENIITQPSVWNTKNISCEHLSERQGKGITESKAYIKGPGIYIFKQY